MTKAAPQKHYLELMNMAYMVNKVVCEETGLDDLNQTYISIKIKFLLEDCIEYHSRKA